MERNNEGMIHFRQDLSLIYDLLDFIIVNDFLLADHLHCEQLPCGSFSD